MKIWAVRFISARVEFSHDQLTRAYRRQHYATFDIGGKDDPEGRAEAPWVASWGGPADRSRQREAHSCPSKKRSGHGPGRHC